MKKAHNTITLSDIETVMKAWLVKAKFRNAKQKKLILKVGDNTPRNSIHRVLERIISNKCAMNCSWKGVRLNYKMCNLTFIKNIRDTICSVHSGLTESEFDITAAEWFRFAKQQAIREEKKNHF